MSAPHGTGAAAEAGPAAVMNKASGRVYLWPGTSLWIGEGRGRTQWHEHHAHQLAVALDGRFSFRTAADGPWSAFAGALVPSHCTHQFEVDTATMAHLFVEPESRAGRALAARFGAHEVAALPADDARAAAACLFDAWRADPSPACMQQAAATALARLAGATAELARELDPRMARALAYIREHVRHPLALADAAAAAHLSESRFRHLFVAETGCSFRAYLLWLRINLAIDAVMRGANWTAAAHEAGFADSAHLTRTHKRMFGIEPSALRLQAVAAMPGQPRPSAGL